MTKTLRRTGPLAQNVHNERFNFVTNASKQEDTHEVGPFIGPIASSIEMANFVFAYLTTRLNCRLGHLVRWEHIISGLEMESDPMV